MVLPLSERLPAEDRDLPRDGDDRDLGSGRPVPWRAGSGHVVAGRVDVELNRGGSLPASRSSADADGGRSLSHDPRGSCTPFY